MVDLLWTFWGVLWRITLAGIVVLLWLGYRNPPPAEIKVDDKKLAP